MAWIKMRVDLHDDPAVIAMCEILKIDDDAVVGKLLRFWGWADSQTCDGNAPSVTETWIDSKVRLRGFSAAMAKVGWLSINANGITIPHYARHNGQTAKSRALTAKRVAKSRNDPVTHEALPDKRRVEDIKEIEKEPPEPEFTPTNLSCVDEILAAYPRQERVEGARLDVQYAIVDLRKGGDSDPAGTLLRLTKEFAASPSGQSGSWTPLAETWFSKKGYKDDPKVWQLKKGPRNGSPDAPKVTPTAEWQSKRYCPG